MALSGTSLISNSPATIESTTDSSSSSNENQRATTKGKASSKGKKTYDKFSGDEEKMLVSLWADKLSEIESKDNRKVWDAIALQINTKFKLNRGTDKYKQKMKYLIDRYKIAKDWNKKQSGGQRRESPYYNKIDEVLGCRDVVTLSHVIDVGNSSSSSAADFNSDDDSDNKEERTERKKSRKRAKTDKDDDEEREFMKNAFDGMKKQHEVMNTFMENYTKGQEQQTQTMNALVGALTTFLQKK